MFADLVLEFGAQIRMITECFRPGLLGSRPLDPLVGDIDSSATADERRKRWIISHQAILP